MYYSIPVEGKEERDSLKQSDPIKIIYPMLGAGDEDHVIYRRRRRRLVIVFSLLIAKMSMILFFTGYIRWPVAIQTVDV